MSDAHTPERWEADEFRVFMGDGGISLHNVPNGIERARLIAAAPDYHTAAREIDRLALVIESAVRFSDPTNLAAVRAALKANQAAIAKATTPNAGEKG